MIRTSNALSALPHHYQHTSFLRASTGDQEEQLDDVIGSGKETVRSSHYPFYQLANRASLGTDKVKDSIGGGDGVGDSACAESTSAHSSPPSLHSEESSMTVTMSFTSRANSASSMNDDSASPRKLNRDPNNVQTNEGQSGQQRSPRKQMDNENDDDDEDAPSTNKLPGIAHLDRHMHAPWKVDRSDARGDDANGYRSFRRSPPSKMNERDSYLADRRYDEDGFSDERHASSFESSRRPSYTDRYSNVGGGNYAFSSVDRLPSYRSMYQRSDSPGVGHREYLHAERADERSYTDEKASNLRHDARSTTWPSSPAFRREGVRETGTGTGYVGHDGPSYNGDGERSSLPPLHHSHPPRDAPPVEHGASRSPTAYAQSGYEAGPRGLGLATDGSTAGDGHRSYGGNGRGTYFTGGMSRPSSSSLRSLSTPYAYDQRQSGNGPQRHPPYNGSPHQQQYDDSIVSSRHSSIGGPMHATHVSSPRHHPYAAAAAAHHGVAGMPAASSTTNVRTPTPSGYNADLPQVSGQHSPGSAPRRRGKLPKPVTDLLKTWLLDHAAHPYPTEDEKRRLCAATGLSISQVSNWFINARRRILVPQGSGHFGIAPPSSSAAAAAAAGGAANEVGSGPVDMDHRRSPPVHPPPYHPHSDRNDYGHASHHHNQQHFYPTSSSSSSSSSHHHPYQHHRDTHHGYQTYASHPPPHASGGDGGAGRHRTGLPLGPPPLPGHQYHGGPYSRDTHGTHGEQIGYRSGGLGPRQSRSPLLDRYPRSADHSPIMSRGRDSP